MKKLFVLITSCLVVSGCGYNARDIIDLKDGDIRTTETEHYILIEKYSGSNGFGHEFWEFEKIINKDSTFIKENEH